MKKIISILLSAAMISSVIAMPVFADYTASSYDVSVISENYDTTGTVDNSIDGTKARDVAAQEVILTCDKFTTEFFMSFDFRFNTVDGAVPGNILITNSTNKVGPSFSMSGGQFRTQTGGSSYQNLGAAVPDTWYTVEFEGKMVVTTASVECRLYKYEAGVKTLVQKTTGMNLRNFYAGETAYGNPGLIKANNISIDNMKFISEYPDELRLTATADSINAGTTASLDYTAFRSNKEVTKYPVTWSVYDEADANPITDGSVSIGTTGILNANIASPSQTVTVRAEASVGGKTLKGTKQIQVSAISTDSEKFDNIVVTGDMMIKAGTSSNAYTFTASKNGTDVTDTVTADDIVWSIYNSTDLALLGNRGITVENGVITVADGILPQNITLRASSTSGNVFGSLPLGILISDSQIETVLATDACEEIVSATTQATSWDGSKAYYTTSGITNQSFGNKSTYVLTELDVKFDANGSGFTLKRADGTIDSCFRYNNGTISMQTGSSSYSVLMTADTNTWYHFEVLYSSASQDASCNIWAYDTDGKLGTKNTFLGISMRNGKDYGALQLEASTYIDNVKISVPAPDSITLTPYTNNMFTGETNEVAAVMLRNSLTIKDLQGVTWEVLGEDGLVIIDDSITINNMGLVTVDALAEPQTITVRVTATNGVVATVPIVVKSGEIFEITNIGINEEETKIVQLNVTKNFAYDAEVVFLVAIYDADGVLKGLAKRSAYGDNLAMGENELTVELELPEGFDPGTYTIKTFAWTSI